MPRKRSAHVPYSVERFVPYRLPPFRSKCVPPWPDTEYIKLFVSLSLTITLELINIPTQVVADATFPRTQESKSTRTFTAPVAENVKVGFVLLFELKRIPKN